MKKLLTCLCGFVLLITPFYVYSYAESSKDSLLSQNIQALLSEGGDGGPTVLGCRRSDGSTCYVFDGNGNLVDKRRNQVPYEAS